MPAPTATYEVKNDNGNVLRTIPLVLGEVRQNGCSVDTTNVMNVADTTDLYVGMAVCCLYVPEGTYITAINSETEVTLSASSNSSGAVTACFKGVNFVPASKAADRGWWRNTFSTTTAWEFKTSLAAHASPQQINGPFAIVPKTFDPLLGAPLSWDVHKPDELAEEPMLRTKTEHWGFWTLISQGGHPSFVPFDPDHSLCLKEINPAS